MVSLIKLNKNDVKGRMNDEHERIIIEARGRW